LKAVAGRQFIGRRFAGYRSPGKKFGWPDFLRNVQNSSPGNRQTGNWQTGDQQPAT
jgi:hypothetical protein